VFRRELTRAFVAFNDTFDATTGDFLGTTISPEKDLAGAHGLEKPKRRAKCAIVVTSPLHVLFTSLLPTQV
jgi:hypothetical protein